MASLEEHRQNMSAFQRALLDQIADSFLATQKGAIARVLHLKSGKAGVMDALRRLGGSFVFENEDHQSGHRYQPTFIGLLVCSKGRAYETLLARYLEYVQAVLLAEPERTEIDSAGVEASLHLTAADSDLLYKLISIGHYFGQFSSHSPGMGWKAGVPNQVDELPEWKSKSEFIQQNALRDYDPKAPVFLAERRAYGFGGPKPLLPEEEPTNYVEKWTKWLLSHKPIAALVLIFIVLAAFAGGVISMRDAFWSEAKSSPARDFTRRRLTDTQVARLAGILATGPKCPVQILWPGGDPAAESLSHDLDRLLERAGFPRSQLSWFERLTTDEGIYIRLPKADGPQDVARSLQEAFKLAGFESTIVVETNLGLEQPFQLQIYVAH